MLVYVQQMLFSNSKWRNGLKQRKGLNSTHTTRSHGNTSSKKDQAMDSRRNMAGALSSQPQQDLPSNTDAIYPQSKCSLGGSTLCDLAELWYGNVGKVSKMTYWWSTSAHNPKRLLTNVWNRLTQFRVLSGKHCFPPVPFTSMDTHKQLLDTKLCVHIYFERSWAWQSGLAPAAGVLARMWSPLPSILYLFHLIEYVQKYYMTSHRCLLSISSLSSLPAYILEVWGQCWWPLLQTGR